MSFLTHLPNVFLSILAFILALGPIIFIHEAGHLLMARAFNIRVLAFSLGFGKRLWGFQRGETDYKLSLFPLGGYVKLGGETQEEASSDPRDFVNRPRWQRILVYLAGPAMNIVLAVLVVAGLFMVGTNLPPRKAEPIIGAVFPNSPAEQAGLASGDRILAINGKKVSQFSEVNLVVMTSAGRELSLTVERDGQSREVRLTPVPSPDLEAGDAGFMGPGKLLVSLVNAGMPAERAGFEVGDEITAVAGRPVLLSQDFTAVVREHPGESLDVLIRRGSELRKLSVIPEGAKGSALVGLGLGYSPLVYQRYPPIQALVESVHYNLDVVRQTFVILGKIFTREVKAGNAVSGPVQMTKMSGEVIRLGPGAFLGFLAFISLSIAILNLLPIPILDGGQITILLVESLRRRDLPMVAKERLSQVGLVLILALMVFVFYVDIEKLVR